MMQRNILLGPLMLLLCSCSGVAFTISEIKSFPPSTRGTARYMTGKDIQQAAATYVEPGRNPNNPLLPELKGDFDWDAKFGSDEDWIVSNIPGKRVLTELELSQQISALDALEQEWKKERQIQEYEKARLLGWTEQAETYNGRYAMFFLVVGLLTEYWTGFSMPAQVEEMLRVLGFIGFDG